jgi:hypothetical protein
VIALLRRIGRPAETRFFLFVGGFGLVLGAIYWFLTYEVAGSMLLLGFGLGGLLVGVALLVERRHAVGRAVEAAGDADANPFQDERGRLPDETLAPLALGLGIALALTAVVFGPWLVVAGLVPLGWGAWTWLTAADDELRATIAAEAAEEAQAAPISTRPASGPG